MNVKLVSLTKPYVIEEGKQLDMTAEELLVYIARVSNPSNQLNTATSDKLIKYMIDNKHLSPFDMINMTVEVTTSKAVGIQILRHWSIKPQEFSQRYAEVTDIEPIELRKNGATNRQSSTEAFDPVMISTEERDYKASELISNYIEEGKKLYKALLNVDVAKECARMILPMATSTTLYLNGSIRSWIFYMQQRCDEHAQKEHQDVANLIKAIFIKNFPMTSKALELYE